MNQSSCISKRKKYNNIIECAAELEKIANSSGEKRIKLILEAKNCVINAISEIAKNCLIGNIELKKCNFKKLEKYKEILRKISKKISLKVRRNLIIQDGGFLPLLIKPTLSLIAGIVGQQISKLLTK